MSIQVCWINDSRQGVLYVAESAWEWEDFHRAIRDSLTLMNEAGGVVHHVIDVTAYTALPSGNALHNFKRAWDLCMSHCNCGDFLILNPNTFGRTLADLFLKVYAGGQLAGRVHFVADRAAALALVETFSAEAGAR